MTPRWGLVSSLFVAAILLGAWLLFVLQLMVAKMLLPVFGGAPAVWNTCMVFFQAGLLAGYAYAHAASERLGVRRHAALHLIVLLLPALSLPIALPAATMSPEGSPIPRLLALLAAMTALPFFVTATTSPLLQRWFAATGHPRARDPYFLYAASNAGSFLGLLSYLIVVEPNLTLREQSRVWTGAYALLALLTAVCAVIALRSRTAVVSEEPAAEASSSSDGEYGWRRVLRWVALAAVPSSLMLAVTTFLSAEIAPMPLLWVAPLAIYLLSYVVAFAGLPAWVDRVLVWALPIALVAEIPLVIDPIGDAPSTRLAIHLGLLFVIATACHRDLARRRPPSHLLTAYYLWVAVGGVLGGVFNALVAPTIYNHLPIVLNRFLDLPVALVLAALLIRPALQKGPAARLGLGGWVLVVVPALALAWLLGQKEPIRTRALIAWAQALLTASTTTKALAAAALALLVMDRPMRFATALVLLLTVGLEYADHQQGPVVYRSRNFFGTLTVREDSLARARRLLHGATMHGLQIRGPEPIDWRTPTLYYFPTGPIGQVFGVYRDDPIVKRVGLVGLGVGSLTCYASVGDDYTVFEVNPEVVRIASDPEFFTHLRDCKVRPRIVPGDARQTLAQEPPERFGLLIVDAFSGDAIPVHLLTKEALELMRDRVTPDGLIAIHVSNRYLDLAPVVAATARAAGLDGIHKLELEDQFPIEERRRGKSPSHWIVLSRRGNDFARLGRLPGWAPLTVPPGVRAWTDDYSDLWSARR